MAYVILHGWLDGLPPVTLQHTSVVSGRPLPVVSSKRFSVAISKMSWKTLINGTGNQRDASQDTLLIHPSLDRLKCQFHDSQEFQLQTLLQSEPGELNASPGNEVNRRLGWIAEVQSPGRNFHRFGT